MRLATCIGCGCNDDNACPGAFDAGCYWVDVNRSQGLGVCSSCPRHVTRWRNGDRMLSPAAIAAVHARRNERGTQTGRPARKLQARPRR